MGQLQPTTKDFKTVVHTKGTICYTRLVEWDLGCKTCERFESVACPKVKDAEDKLVDALRPVDEKTVLTYHGEKRTLREWCTKLGYYPSTIKRRINEYGNSVRYAFAREPDIKRFRQEED